MEEVSKKELIQKIFWEIEDIINNSISLKPVKLSDSKFLKKFKKLKKKYEI